MELVVAVIKPFRLTEAVAALHQLGVTGCTMTEVKGFGRQGGHSEVYRGTEYRIELVPKVQLEVLCDADQVDAVVDALAAAARTGKVGDGKVWVRGVEQVRRVRTGEVGVEAL